MQLPILAPAPLVSQHAEAFKDLFENQKQYRHFQNYLTGLMVLPNKSMANISRCILDSADKTNLSRFMSEAPWRQEQVNDRRLSYLQQETKLVRKSKSVSALVIDDSLCEHVGSLFEYVDRHRPRRGWLSHCAQSGDQPLCQWCRSISSRFASVSTLRRNNTLGNVCVEAFSWNDHPEEKERTSKTAQACR
jgi:hypothetical protein